MSSKFNEVQSFSQWWLWISLLALFIPIYSTGASLSFSQNWYKMLLEILTYVPFYIWLAVVVFFAMIMLRTEISDNGVYVDFKPFLWNKTYRFEDIRSYKVVKYSIFDYGGWGMRISSSGVAYTTKGKYGLKLTLKNGKQILIGTQRPEELSKIMDEFIKSKKADESR
ncbi:MULTISPECIES: hypothetical protein [Sphingobacterium]|uniref:hypothetical protein n=1 Tax=Sphingobacterium TaxID=28453 RepID=UPI001919BBB6|nr:MULTISPECIES: hypothetical protein [Sphingobacterium]QQT28047.1 hypothetical protein I6J02_09485 [Sphingobacterium spiritivorum]